MVDGQIDSLLCSAERAAGDVQSASIQSSHGNIEAEVVLPDLIRDRNLQANNAWSQALKLLRKILFGNIITFSLE